ncbi:MAG: GNAT family N-acetyltransferase, partial [Myxococcota bacterium]
SKMAAGWARKLKSDDAQGLLILAVLDAQSPEDDNVAGFVWAELSQNPGPHAHIRSLWVRPQNRRQGVAYRLKAELETWAMAQGAQWIQTEVHIDNSAMRALNTKLGYHDTFIQQKKTLG